MNNPLFSGFAASFSSHPRQEADDTGLDDQGDTDQDHHSTEPNPSSSAAPEEADDEGVDLTKENVDVDLQNFDVPTFQQVSKETADLAKLAQQYEEEAKEIPGDQPPKPARLGSFLSVDTKVLPGKSLDSPAHSEVSEDEKLDLLDVSSDVNRLDADVGDIKERVQSLSDGQGIFRGQMASVESRIENLDKKISEMQQSISELTKSMNAYQTATAAAIGAVSRKHKIMGDKELSTLAQSLEPPSVVTHGSPSSDVSSPSGTTGKKAKKIANLDDWGL